MPSYLIEDQFTGTSGGAGVGGGFIQKVAQTFTASSDYTMARVGLKLKAFDENNTINGAIYSTSAGVPNASLRTFIIEATVGSFDTTYALLNSSLELSEGAVYAVVLFVPGSPTFIFWNDNIVTGTPYAGGQGYWYVVNDPTYGTTWLVANQDRHFIIFSEYSLSPTPSHEAIDILVFPVLSWVVD